MIDYTSLEIINFDLDYLLNNPLFNFTQPINKDTGELKPNRFGYEKRVATIGNLLLELTTNKENNYTNLKVKGSLHKFYHENQNYTDFDFSQLTNCINHLCKILNTTPQNCIIHHLEFGVNINPIHNANNVLNSIICYNGKPFELKEFKGTGNLKRFITSQYIIKIYNKGLQYQLTDNILRYEIKVETMQYLTGKGHQIKTLNDLLNIEKISSLINLLVQTFDNLYFFDYRINTNAIKKQTEKTLILEGKNPNYWNEYRKQVSKNSYHKRLKKYNELVLKLAPDNLKETIKNCIIDKWQLLQKGCTILPSVKSAKGVRSYTHIVGNNVPTNKRYCKTCHRDISHQKNNSEFCSEKYFGKQVKQCRNRVSNFKTHENRFYKGNLLFDVDVYLSNDYLQLKQIAFKN